MNKFLAKAPDPALGSAEFCEFCCAQAAGVDAEIIGASDRECNGIASELVKGLVGALRFIGMLMFFSIAIWFFPVSETPQQKRRRLEREVNERKREADFRYRWLCWADNLDKRDINHNADEALKRSLRDLEARMNDTTDHYHERIRQAKAAGDDAAVAKLKRDLYMAEQEHAYAVLQCKKDSEFSRLKALADDEALYKVWEDHVAELDKKHLLAEQKLRSAKLGRR